MRFEAPLQVFRIAARALSRQVRRTLLSLVRGIGVFRLALLANTLPGLIGAPRGRSRACSWRSRSLPLA